MKNRKVFLGISLIALMVSGIVPVYAEVSELESNQQAYIIGNNIIFSGKVEEDSTGLVTIVIRDTTDKFVVLSQAIIEADYTFTKKVEIGEKFSTHGLYNATAFIANMTDGAETTFHVSQDGSLFSFEDVAQNKSESTQETQSQRSTENTEPESSGIADFVDPEQDPQYYLDRYYNEVSYKSWFDQNYPGLTIEEAVGYIEPEPVAAEPESSGIADFVDPEQDPQYYLDRYYNEVSYKSWFDQNYPGLTIEEAVGYIEPESESLTNEITEMISEDIISEKIIPDAQAISAPAPVIQNEFDMSDETTQMILAFGGLGILLGAVYGVKRRVDDNTEQISKNRSAIKKRLSGLLSNDPLDVIRDRLAKGEISLEDYNNLRKTLSDK